MSLSQKLGRLQNLRDEEQKKLQRVQQQRLMVGLNIFFLLILSQVFKGFYLELLAVLFFLPLFLFFVGRSRRRSCFLKKIEGLHTFYQRQWDLKQGRILDSYPPEQMNHPDLARDLDLGLLYPQLNFCFSEEGQRQLDAWLCQDFSGSNREDRQKHLKELIQLSGPLRRLHALHALKNPVRMNQIQKEVERSFFSENTPWKWIVPLSWLGLVVLVSLVVLLFLPVPPILLKVVFFVYIASVLLYLGQTKHLFSRLQDLQKDFEGLAEKIHAMEKIASQLSFAPTLKKKVASQDTRSLSRYISLMSLRTNPILFYILNLLLPWDFLLSELCERARVGFALHFKSWCHEMIDIETLSCLANLKLYQDTTWPELSSSTFLEFEEISHPLLNQCEVVKNNFHPESHKVIIITGSNMSGKSTFLRAIGINLVLANIGAPVFAKRFHFRPMNLVSCIRVSDSLRDGQSYFYAEVRRMRTILEKAQQGPVLFLIDEPLRGTNNKERLIGNTSYLKQILATEGAGFLCTHDLELTKLSEVSEEIANFHFSETMQDQDWIFDYKIKHGPSTSTNALRILAKEGLYPESLTQS